MYPAVNEHRMAFDIDGTEVGYRYQINVPLSALFGNGISTWLSAQSKQNLNREDRPETWGASAHYPGLGFWFFFPELREVTKLGIQYPDSPISVPVERVIQGSTDTTNGIDGTWENAVFSMPNPSSNKDNWRSNIFTISFSGPVKALRFGIRHSSLNTDIRLCGIHVYGRKAATETVHDVGFTNPEGADVTSLIDWGDRPEGTTLVNAYKVKNLSATKIANNINLQLNHSDFTMAWSEDGPWQSVLDIASLSPGALSTTFYVRNQLQPPLLILGPKAARIIASIGSFT